jgi:hypothetical protein
MDMGMKPELLVPAVQHTEETNLCTEVSAIAGDFEKSFRAGTKQEIVDHLFVLQEILLRIESRCNCWLAAPAKSDALTTVPDTCRGTLLLLRAISSDILEIGPALRNRAEEAEDGNEPL